MEYIPRKKGKVDSNQKHVLSLELYSSKERKLLMKLNPLFRSWHETFRKAEDPSGMIIRDFSADDMCFDGFYPGYLKQRVKTLFVGKESRGISGYNYLELLYKAIKVGRIGTKSLNRSEFHRRILYIAYYLQTGECDYSEIPYAQELSLLFGTEKLSFAFMNLSKFSNENVAYQADYELIGKAVDLSTKDRNYIQEEISILAPDLILTMNLRNLLSSLGTLKPIMSKKYEGHLSAAVPIEYPQQRGTLSRYMSLFQSSSRAGVLFRSDCRDFRKQTCVESSCGRQRFENLTLQPNKSLEQSP